MNGKAPTAARRPDPAGVLLAAAEGFATGTIAWGVGWFYDPKACTRCALGGIAWAIDPADAECDPKFSGPAADAAMRTLADYLVDELGAARVLTDGDYDVIETVGAWNDTYGRDVDEVVAALEGAAEQAMAVTA